MHIIIFLNGVSVDESHHYKRERYWMHLSWISEEAQTAMGDHDSVHPARDQVRVWQIESYSLRNENVRDS